MRGTRAFAWGGTIRFGALVPTLIVAGWSRQIMILPWAFAVTLGHPAILGLPVALRGRARNRNLCAASRSV